jgi:IS30 family transposase
LRRTLTLDNGKESAQHERLPRETQLRVYTAEPYRTWQRESNEHTNDLLRQYDPKGTDFHDITRLRVQRATARINHRPRKRLNYHPLAKSSPNDSLLQLRSDSAMIEKLMRRNSVGA